MSIPGYKFFFDEDAQTTDRVFVDPSRGRQRRVGRHALSIILLVATWLILFLDGTVSISQITGDLSRYWQSQRVLQSTREFEQSTTAIGQQNSDSGLQEAAFDLLQSKGADCQDNSQPAFAAFAQGPLGEQYLGHVPTEFEWAAGSLQQSCDLLDLVTSDWITLSDGPDGIELKVKADEVREPVQDYVANAAHSPQLISTVSLELESQPDAFLERLLDPGIREALVSDLIFSARDLNLSGLCFDFGQLKANELNVLEPFFVESAAALRAADLESCVALSVSQEIWADQDLMQSFDRVVLKAFSSPWVGSPAVSLARPDWFEAVVEKAISVVGREALTVAISNFAVQWSLGQPQPETLSYAEAMNRIAESEGRIRFSAKAGGSFSAFRSDDGESHKIWMLDASTAHNQLLTLQTLGVSNIAIWSIGQEDPGLWDVLKQRTAPLNELAAKLSVVPSANYVAYEGEGAFLRILRNPVSGLRTVSFDPSSGLATSVQYQSLPRPYLLERYGKPDGKKLVLTFDDGPHAEYTAQILDILKTTNTPASFFVVGARIMENPDLLNRILDEGHEIGGHTFSHPRMDQISKSRSALEHGLTSKIIAGYAGRSTALYREPFMRTGGPVDPKRVAPLAEVQARGEIIAGMDILAKDWNGETAEEIVQDVFDRLETGEGNVILLHDGGDNRSETVRAVPILIKELRARGYEFTTLADLLGTTPQALMPQVADRWVTFDRISFNFLTVTWQSFNAIFWIILVIGVSRSLLIFVLSNVRKDERPLDLGGSPKVTVIIPAHNEEKVIAKCVRNVLKSDYDNFDVIVVDDGSTDLTFEKLLGLRNSPKFKIFAQLNQGKWRALNLALANTDAEYVVCIDADTLIEPDAIRHLVKHFSNPKIGAVAGKINVGNRKGLLARLQALEYITSQNFDRRAYAQINGMLVVLGAIGAWRTEALRKAGGFTGETLAEDADMTIAVNRAGYRITFENKAVAYTEAPVRVKQLLAQRLRWSLGMLQCAWKHKAAIRKGKSIGLVSIPDMFAFGYLLPLLAPIADIFVIIFLYNWFTEPTAGELGAASRSTPPTYVIAYLLLPVLDLLIAAYAIKKDGQAQYRLLLLFPFQRLFYRQLLYYSVYRSVFRAIIGRLTGWGKMVRVGNAQLARAPA